jgi:hypothetical protein
VLFVPFYLTILPFSGSSAHSLQDEYSSLRLFMSEKLKQNADIKTSLLASLKQLALSKKHLTPKGRTPQSNPAAAAAAAAQKKAPLPKRAAGPGKTCWNLAS